MVEQGMNLVSGSLGLDHLVTSFITLANHLVVLSPQCVEIILSSPTLWSCED